MLMQLPHSKNMCMCRNGDLRRWLFSKFGDMEIIQIWGLKTFYKTYVNETHPVLYKFIMFELDSDNTADSFKRLNFFSKTHKQIKLKASNK